MEFYFTIILINIDYNHFFILVKKERNEHEE